MRDREVGTDVLAAALLVVTAHAERMAERMAHGPTLTPLAAVLSPSTRALARALAATSADDQQNSRRPTSSADHQDAPTFGPSLWPVDSRMVSPRHTQSAAYRRHLRDQGATRYAVTDGRLQPMSAADQDDSADQYHIPAASQPGTRLWPLGTKQDGWTLVRIAKPHRCALCSRLRTQGAMWTRRDLELPVWICQTEHYISIGLQANGEPHASR